MKVLLPNTIDLSSLRLPSVQAEVYDVHTEIPTEHFDAEVLVVWGNGEAQLRHAARVMRKLKLVASLSAGADKIQAAGFSHEVILTNGVGLHERPVAEHAVAMLLAAARRIHELRDAQHRNEWLSNLGGIQPVHAPNSFRSLIGAHVAIWGFGSIGKRLAHLLETMDAQVTGIARHEGESNGIPLVSSAKVAAVLPAVDALVMILPSQATNFRVLNAEKIALLPRHAWIVNVGRGNTIDEAALSRALKAGEIAGAALDVFENEPLPAESPLWQLPNVIISPHSAGGRPMGVERLLRHNLEALLSGQALKNVIGPGPHVPR